MEVEQERGGILVQHDWDYTLDDNSEMMQRFAEHGMDVFGGDDGSEKAEAAAGVDRSRWVVVMTEKCLDYCEAVIADAAD